MKKIPGVVIGIVKSLNDPRGEGRIELEFPWLAGSPSAWASVGSLMGGKKRGVWFMPEIDDEALVAFEQGNFAHPYIVGFLWNGVDKPPVTDPRRRLIRSVNGHEIEIYDPEIRKGKNGDKGDKGYIRLKDAHGNVVELANARITIRSVATVEIQAPNIVINGRPVAPVGPPI